MVIRKKYFVVYIKEGSQIVDILNVMEAPIALIDVYKRQVYDAGYDEWILWSAANRYHYGGLLTPEEAEAEEAAIVESRAALPPETETETAAETEAGSQAV